MTTTQTIAFTIEGSAETPEAPRAPAKDWTMPLAPQPGAKPYAYDTGGGWYLYWGGGEDDDYGVIEWPFGPADAATPNDLKAAGFTIMEG